jgi:hypothetical protein
MGNFKKDNHTLKHTLYSILIVELIFVIYSYIFFSINHRLPHPFFYNAADSFMDFFNANYWANFSQRFTDWGSVYPPLIFLISKSISPSDCMFINDTVNYRECSISSIYLILFSGILGSIVCSIATVKSITRKKNTMLIFLLAIAYIFSMPSLFALERGNYILLAFALLSLSWYFQNILVRVLFLALAINIKPYLIVISLAYFLKKQFIFLAYLITLTSLIYLVTAEALNDPNHYLIFSNILNFSTNSNINILEFLSFPTSIFTFFYLADRVFPNFADLFLALKTLLLTMLAIFSIVFISKNYKVMSVEHICFFILLAFFIFSNSAGGYALVLLYPLIPYIYNSSFKPNKFLLSALIFTFTPLDFDIYTSPNHLLHYFSFIGDNFVSFPAAITIGTFIRPLCLFAIFINFCKSYSSSHRLRKDFSYEV